eukprot:TRINITY_DN10064_c0_g1_i2.p1 TRINITY_DN10064_c0_g1~~TRINITY_DN10064_c0_g1_i2.p1  ORF type:complete len:128 (+),score=14.00 TRINITY_DN10064_c0_g1_i2:14-397(+)
MILSSYGQSFLGSANGPMWCSCFFFNDTATTEIYTRSIVGSVRCVQETDYRLVGELHNSFLLLPHCIHMELAGMVGLLGLRRLDSGEASAAPAGEESFHNFEREFEVEVGLLLFSFPCTLRLSLIHI